MNGVVPGTSDIVVESTLLAITNPSFFGIYELSRDLVVIKGCFIHYQIFRVLLLRESLPLSSSCMRLHAESLRLLDGLPYGDCASVVGVSMLSFLILLDIGQVSAERSHVLVCFIDE